MYAWQFIGGSLLVAVYCGIPVEMLWKPAGTVAEAAGHSA
jgi:hypothetical protein